MLPSGSVKFMLHGSVGESKKKNDSLFPRPLIFLTAHLCLSALHNPPTISADILSDTAYLGLQPSVTSGK